MFPSHDQVWKDIFVSDGSLKFVAADFSTSSFTSTDLATLKSGKSIVTESKAGFTDFSQQQAFFNEVDDNTFLKASISGELGLVADNQELIKVKGGSNTGSVTFGVTSSLGATSFEITGSSLKSVLPNWENTGDIINCGDIYVTCGKRIMSQFSGIEDSTVTGNAFSSISFSRKNRVVILSLP